MLARSRIRVCAVVSSSIISKDSTCTDSPPQHVAHGDRPDRPGCALLGAPQFQRVHCFRCRRDHARLMMLMRSGGGRSFGWFLEYHGERVARLHYRGFADMFWDEYRVEPLGTGTWELLARDEAWMGSNMPSRAKPDVSMRALYIDLHPSVSQWSCYWLTRWSRQRTSARELAPR
jgi:hypothetical protein